MIPLMINIKAPSNGDSAELKMQSITLCKELNNQTHYFIKFKFPAH